MPSRFALHTRPLPRLDHVVTGATWRVTVITERLLRLEWSAAGRFEDRATQVVLDRDLGPATFTVTRVGDGVRVETPHLRLDYDGRPFSPGGLSVTQLGMDHYASVWRHGAPPLHKLVPSNCGGTARTLDEADGAVDLEPGLASIRGFAELDDSRSLALDGSWVTPRTGDPDDIDLYLFVYGHDFAAAVRDFQRLAGPTPLLPRWALGNWWSRYHAYTAEEYQQLVERFEAERLPFSVAVIDMDWHRVDIPPGHGSGWTGFSWNTDLFPDPPAFLGRLHAHGLRVALNLHPASGVRSFEDAYARLARRLGLDPDAGSPIEFAAHDPAFLAAYLDEVLHPLEDDGVDLWWLDWQQGSATPVPGLDPLWALNHAHFLDSARDGRRGLTFSRYAGPGSHRYPVGFSGDTVNSWESLAFQPYFTATAANIAYGWWSHDIGGHMFGHRDEELVARWFQLGTFSPINRLHSTNSPFQGKEPWNYRAEPAAAMTEALRLRHRLVPYLHTMNERAHRLGEPLVRPLYWVDPRPDTFLENLTSFAFGTELLVAPITSPADPRTRTASVTTWLPAGTWIDWFTGLRYTGGRRITLHRPLDQYPVLARAGAIIPLAAGDAPGVDNPAALDVRVFAGADGTFELYEDDDAGTPRALRTRFTWSDADGVLTIAPAAGDLGIVPPTRHYTVRVSGWGDPVEVEVGAVETATGTTVRVPRPQDGGGNDVLRHVFAALQRAEVRYLPKERAWAALRTADPAARPGILEGLGLEPELRAVLMEILLADPA